MIAIMWQFDVKKGREGDFEQFYVPDGARFDKLWIGVQGRPQAVEPFTPVLASVEANKITRSAWGALVMKFLDPETTQSSPSLRVSPYDKAHESCTFLRDAPLRASAYVWRSTISSACFDATSRPT